MPKLFAASFTRISEFLFWFFVMILFCVPTFSFLNHSMFGGGRSGPEASYYILT